MSGLVGGLVRGVVAVRGAQKQGTREADKETYARRTKERELRHDETSDALRLFLQERAQRRAEDRDERMERRDNARLGLDRERLGLEREKAAREGGGKPTEFERKAALVLPRAEQANTLLDRFDKATLKQGLLSKVTGGNYGLSDDEQALNQAGEQFIFSVLRPESGAQVTDSEREYYQTTFLPRPGDSDAVLAQKRQARATAIEALRHASSRALPPAQSRPAPPPSAGGKGNIDLGAQAAAAQLSAADRARAARDPKFRAWLASRGITP